MVPIKLMTPAIEPVASPKANTVQQAVRAGQYAAKALAALFDSSV